MADGQRPLTFVDVFAGAGGLSLGLMQAGLRGCFAVEQENNAFATLKANLIDGGDRYRFDWPSWLPVRPYEIGRLIREHRQDLTSLRGTVDLLAGGPPCQGFSPAGRRESADPRNRLFLLYIEMARILSPTFVLFENVPGINIEFGKTRRRRENPRRVGRPPLTYAARVMSALGSLGYDVHVLNEIASDYGIPQSRRRYLIIGVKAAANGPVGLKAVQHILREERDAVLEQLCLPRDRIATVRDAISDLETYGNRLVDCADSKGFRQLQYRGPETEYQMAMHAGMATSSAPNSMRLACHRSSTTERFQEILSTCRRGVSVTAVERKRMRIGKMAITPLHPDKPSKTLTSLPDDLIHYAEPRILTVREYARLQSFPDWFKFEGVYTTGGERRRHTVPRYTQVANAVPPLLGQVLGRTVDRIASRLQVDGGSRDVSMPSVIAS